MLDPEESPEEIKSREVELGSESWTSFALVVPQQQCSGRKLQALVYDILLWRKVPESDARSVLRTLFL